MLKIKRFKEINEHELDASSVRNIISELRVGLSNLGFQILNIPMEKPVPYKFNNAKRDLLKDTNLNEEFDNAPEADALIAGYPNLKNPKLDIMIEVVGQDTIITFNPNIYTNNEGTERIVFTRISPSKILGMIKSLI